MTFKLLPSIEGGQLSCLCCGPRKSQLCADFRIGVGFGFAGLTMDGNTVWQEDTKTMEFEQLLTVAQAEEIAAADPDHDWRIELQGPMRGSTYQRQGEMKWVLVNKNAGFA